VFLGLDFGTSGARAVAVGENGEVLAERAARYCPPPPFGQPGGGGVGAGDGVRDAGAWRTALSELLAGLPSELRARACAISVDGTSATCLVVDGGALRGRAASGARTGSCAGALCPPLVPPAMYCDEAAAEGAEVAAACPLPAAAAPTSTLAKLAAWHAAGVGGGRAAWEGGKPPALLHQADWLLLQLHGRCDGEGRTDFNNALKLGFDPAADDYAPWVARQAFAPALPRTVVAPGTSLGPVCPEARRAFGLPEGCQVCAGTTDSIAAFLAAGVDEPGGAVTSLGSTLALKLLSTERVEDAASGIYSHKLRDGLWLVGGASNVGGAALRQHFTDEEVVDLSARLDPDTDSGLDFYPLPARGERFPVADPYLEPRLNPVPEDRARYLQGFLEGIARVEAEGYRKLEALGASRLTHVVTAGGGSVNEAWNRIRARYLGVPVEASRQKEAAYGAALLALRSAAAPP